MWHTARWATGVLVWGPFFQVTKMLRFLANVRIGEAMVRGRVTPRTAAQGRLRWTELSRRRFKMSRAFDLQIAELPVFNPSVVTGLQACAWQSRPYCVPRGKTGRFSRPSARHLLPHAFGRQPSLVLLGPCKAAWCASTGQCTGALHVLFAWGCRHLWSLPPPPMLHIAHNRLTARIHCHMLNGHLGMPACPVPPQGFDLCRESPGKPVITSIKHLKGFDVL